MEGVLAIPPRRGLSSFATAKSKTIVKVVRFNASLMLHKATTIS